MAQMKLLTRTEIELVNRIDMLMVEITGDPLVGFVTFLTNKFLISYGNSQIELK